MKEVYKGNEILESFHQDHLFKYHNWLLRAANQYGSAYEAHNELQYNHIAISSLTIIEDGKVSIKENFHRDKWIKNDCANFYADRISRGFILLYRASFEIEIFDEHQKYKPEEYRDDFLFDIRCVNFNEKDNKYGWLSETKDLDVNLLIYKDNLTKNIDNLSSVYELELIRRPELTRDDFEIEYYQQEEDEKNERIESWEGFEDEIY